MPYSIFVPRNYDTSKKYPLIVMLHGLNITAADHEVWIRHNPANIAKIFEFFNSHSKATQR